MKKIKVEYSNKYECPSLRFSSLEMCGFLCVSEVKVDEDEWITEDEEEFVIS